MIKNLLKCKFLKIGQKSTLFPNKKHQILLKVEYISNSLNYNLFFNLYNIDLPISLSCRQIVKQNIRNIYGQFYIGPFFIGQGLTVANALRRTLLSELSSLAITSVHIKDVMHQYQTIQGLQESVFDFLLNIKDVVLKSKQILTVPQIGYLQVQGPCILKAQHLLLPPFIQCVDPDQYIATLTDDGLLNLKFIIRQGKYSLTHVTPGYDLVSQKYNQQNNFQNTFMNTYSKNLIIDASFNPVIKVNYIIELLDFDQNFFEKDTLKLQSNDVNNLYLTQEQFLIKKEIIILEIWTNGSISPIMALKVSIQQLIRLFLKMQKSKLLNIELTHPTVLYKHLFEQLNNKQNTLKFGQCQTLSYLKDSKIQHISVSEKFLIQKLKYLINQLESVQHLANRSL